MTYIIYFGLLAFVSYKAKPSISRNHSNSPNGEMEINRELACYYIFIFVTAIASLCTFWGQGAGLVSQVSCLGDAIVVVGV